VFILVALALVAVGLAGSSGFARASSTTVYSASTTLPIPPAQNFVSASGGDGYDVSLYNGRVFNVFHHQRDVIVDCHVQVDATPCWSGGAKTITDNSGNHFSTSTQAGTYVDQSTGRMYVYAIRSSDLTGGVVCIDLTTAADSNPNPFCGFTALTNPGETKISSGNGAAFLSTPMKVGNKLFAFNYYPGSGVSGAKNAVLCFDLTTDAACTAQPHAPTLGAGTVSSSCPCGGEAAIGTKLIIPVSMITPARAELVCFDTTTLGNCSGTWPMMSTSVAQPAVNTYGAAYPLLSTNGSTINGFCLPNGTDPCYTLSGTATSTPTGMATAVTSGDTGTNGPAVVLGPRVYLPNHNNNTVECWDYSTSAKCTGFPLAISNLSGLYTVNPDPQRPTCIWVNSDAGTWQIQNFDAYTGGPCTQTRVLAASLVAPQVVCYPNSYQSIQVVAPSPTNYQGGTVSFADAGGNSIPGLSSVPLDATGTANLTGLSLNTASGLPQFIVTLTNAPVTPGPFTVRLDWTSTYDPSCTGSNPTTTTLDANLSDGTTTAKTLTEWQGTPVDNNATLSGTNAATATGVVAYHWWTDNTCTTKATTDSVQTITTPGTLPPSDNVNLPAGVYYETVDYSGDSLNLPSSTSCGSEVLTVKPVPTNVTYTGDTSVYAGHSANICFVLKDSRDGSTLAGMPVTLTLPDGSTYPTTTDANGSACDTVTASMTPGPYPVSESFGGQGKYLASSGPGTLTVNPIPTSITYTGDTSVYSGDPLTVSYVLVDKWGNPLANMPVTINLPGGGTYPTTTDANGVASDTITAPAETSNTTLPTSESFAGQTPYLLSSGPGSVLVKVIPTNITYTGDTSVYSGQPATLSYVLKDSGGNLLANTPVTITLPAGLGGGTVSGKTDANGVFSTTVTSPIVSSDTTEPTSESFAGLGKYLPSSGLGSLVVHPIPTNVTYIGDTSVYSGDPLTVSYVLTDKWGNPLANMPVTINLPGGGTYPTTTDSFGVASDTITAPAETSNTTLGTTESFGGQAQYLASSGPGSVLVKVIPTNVTYTGDTSVYSGQPATISFVLKDSGGNTLAGMPVTITLPDGSTYPTTTDANGVASDTITSAIVSSDTTYTPSESFAGQGKYLASSGPGSLVVHPIPTNVTYIGDTSVYSGDPLTVSYVLTDKWGNPLANMPVTINLPGGGTYPTTTDSFGVASDTITAPAETSNTTLGTTETFGGQAQYLPSSGPGSVLVKVIPTNVTYNGDTSVYAGQPASISFVLTDSSNNVLSGKSVTITLPAALGGGTVTGTTDANGVFSTTVTAPNVSSNTTYTPSEAFAGQGKYLASSGPGSLVVKPLIPTSVTYTGDTSVFAGDPLTVSYVLKDSGGNVLANMPVTINLPGGGTYPTTTDANGVASDTITAPAETSNTTLGTTESFGGQTPYLPSSGPGSVLVKVVPTTITYTGDTSVYSGQSATISFVLTDSSANVLAGKSVTITLPAALGGGTVTGTTDANGVLSTTVTAPNVSSNTTYTPSESFAGQGKYLASNGPGSLVVKPIPTSITYTGDTSVYSGDPLTVSYVLTNSVTGNPLAHMPVTINLPGGGTYPTTTDANGVASDTITAPAETSNTTLGTTETFGGQTPYLASNGPGSVLVKVVPTTITYNGDTSVISGQPANISFVLKDSSNNVLASKSVTITLPAGLGGGTVTGTTDANGVFSTTVTAPNVGSDTTYTPSEAFAGQGKYLASSGPGSIVVHPAPVVPVPTTITYTGDTSVYSGQTAHLSFVLTDSSNNVLGGMPVTITLPAGLGGGTVSGTTDPNGVFSTSVTAPNVAANTTYTPSEGFAGQGKYLASNGPGSLVVKPIPTTVTYTGDTNVYAASPATISFVLKNALNGQVLAGMPVTISLPGGGTASGTTDANGVFSKTITAPGPSVTTSYPTSEIFGGQAPYLASAGPGTLTVNPIPTITTYTGPTSGTTGATTTVTATLIAAPTSTPLAGKSVTITVGGLSCTGTTNASGVVSCTIVMNLSSGTYPVTASFAGSGYYLASSGPGTFTIGAWNSGNGSMGFWKGPNGQKIISNGPGMNGVAKLTTWLRAYAPFQDLSATANCNADATYVANVINAASGSNMNSMLKAQMLAAALDIFFSTSGLGGSQIGSSWSYGLNTYNLTNVPGDGSAASAFGGATSMKLGDLLTYAANQSNAGGSTWYGNSKTLQTLAKDVFADISTGTLPIQ
jgi:uncharacterized protein (DUF2345 family)